VLIVDDNKDGAEMLSVAWMIPGHEVQTAFDGPSAVRAADEFRPNVVLLDLGLPVLDGYAVARLLRSREYGSKLMLIAVSGYGLQADPQRSADSGFDLTW
jgi:CheY-like chemotaxis protein